MDNRLTSLHLPKYLANSICAFRWRGKMFEKTFSYFYSTLPLTLYGTVSNAFLETPSQDKPFHLSIYLKKKFKILSATLRITIEFTVCWNDKNANVCKIIWNMHFKSCKEFHFYHFQCLYFQKQNYMKSSYYTVGETKLKTLYFSHISSVRTPMYIFYKCCTYNVIWTPVFCLSFFVQLGTCKKENIRWKKNTNWCISIRWK